MLNAHWNYRYRFKSHTVYIIQFSDDVECFIKVGITCSLKQRLKTYSRIGYQIKLIRSYPYPNRDTAVDFELGLRKAFPSLHYTPNRKFAGYTECYTLDILNAFFDE